MKKLISRQTHSVIDYTYAAAVSSSPETIGFRDEETATALCRLLGSGVVMSSLMTRYELGLIRVMPFKAHLALDVVTGLFTVAAPWLSGFSRNRAARNTFVTAGAFSVLAGLMTEPKEMK